MDDDDLNKKLEDAASNNDTDLVKKLIDSGASDFTRGLCAAVEYANLELVKFFVDLGANAWDGYGSILSYNKQKCKAIESYLRQIIQRDINDYNDKKVCCLCDYQNHYGEKKIIVHECLHVFHHVCIHLLGEHGDKIVCPECKKSHIAYLLDVDDGW